MKCVNVCRKINEWINGFCAEKIYIDLLNHIKQNKDNMEDRFFNYKPSIKLHDNFSKMREDKIEKSIDYLIRSNYLATRKSNASFVFITDEGGNFFE